MFRHTPTAHKQQKAGQKMRYLGLLIGLVVLAASASAEPLSIQQAMRELENRGAKSLSGALLFGDPVIMGEFDGQGFKLILGSCDRSTLGLDCRATVFSACKPVSVLGPQRTFDAINAYNRETEARGVLYSDTIIGLGNALCVKVRRDFHGEDVFDLSDISDWKLTIRDFEAYVDGIVRKRDAEAILSDD